MLSCIQWAFGSSFWCQSFEVDEMDLVVGDFEDYEVVGMDLVVEDLED